MVYWWLVICHTLLWMTAIVEKIWCLMNVLSIHFIHTIPLLTADEVDIGDSTTDMLLEAFEKEGLFVI